MRSSVMSQMTELYLNVLNITCAGKKLKKITQAFNMRHGGVT